MWRSNDNSRTYQYDAKAGRSSAKIALKCRSRVPLQMQRCAITTLRIAGSSQNFPAVRWRRWLRERLPQMVNLRHERFVRTGRLNPNLLSRQTRSHAADLRQGRKFAVSQRSLQKSVLRVSPQAPRQALTTKPSGRASDRHPCAASFRGARCRPEGRVGGTRGPAGQQ